MKPRILDDGLLAKLAREHGTPLWVHDAQIIERRIADLAGFDTVRYAMKANSSLAILGVVRRSGALVDAVSAGEIARALASGFAPHEIVFTADLFDRAALEWIGRHDIAVNLGSPSMIEQYGERFPGRAITLRINPGFGHGHGPKVNTGGETSKHGIWHAALAACLESARRFELRVTGLHVHIGSGSDFENLTRVCDAMTSLARVAGRDLELISAGGGLPIPYRDGEPPFDVARFRDTWLAARTRIARELGRKLRIEVEPGRYLVAESGCLLTEVRGQKTNGRYDYVLVDAGFHNLLRPALYGAYHQISLVGAPDGADTSPRVVAGPLCESADVFTRAGDGTLEPQPLPDAVIGDLLCIHDTGAYGASMSSNYNSQPFAAEVLVDRGVARVVRPRQTIDELLAPEERTIGDRQ
jgi:diaminopimelate decarboxylase